VASRSPKSDQAFAWGDFQLGRHLARLAELEYVLEDLVERIPLAGEDGEPLRRELEEFLRAARGESSRLVSAREGREALEIALRIGRQIERFADVTLETA
jgi:predicted dehydrogenase